MKVLILILIVITHFKVLSTVIYSTPYVSFFNLINKPAEYNEKEIHLNGYFLKTEEGNYLCMNMEACLTRGEERVRVRGIPEDNESDINKCHIGLTGKYISLNQKENGHWPFMGFIDVKTKYTTSFLNGYEAINDSCEIYRRLKEIKYPVKQK
jgi:hypothetical protein